MSAGREKFVAAFGRSVNLAGLFDRRDTQPGWPFGRQHVDAIAAAGFDGVRLPVRWWGRADPTAPYTLDARLVADVADVLDALTARGLSTLVTMHHADAVQTDPVGSLPRLAALWRQIAERFADHGGSLAFELLNEPRMGAAAWQHVSAHTLSNVRDIDPDRVVVLGGVYANSVDGLLQLEPPAGDANLIATIHYYEPFRFTHQGAFWEPDSTAWLGTRWGTPEDHRAVQEDLHTAAAWAADRGLPLLVGEFGALSRAGRASRIAWTASVRRTAEQLGLMWGYWDFATDFGVYNLTEQTWHADLLASLFD